MPIKLWGQSPVACCLKRQRAEWGETLPSLGCGNYQATASESGSDWGKEDRFTRSPGSVRYPIHSIFPLLKEKACGDGRQGGDQVRGSFQLRFRTCYFEVTITYSHSPPCDEQSLQTSEAEGMAWENLLVSLREDKSVSYRIRIGIRSKRS